MALITCPECKKQISEFAASCPNCGCPASMFKAKIPDSVVDLDGTAFSDCNRIAPISQRNSKVFYVLPEGYHVCGQSEFVLAEKVHDGLFEAHLRGRLEIEDCFYYDITACKSAHDRIILPKEIDGKRAIYDHTKFENTQVESITFEYGVNSPRIGQAWEFIGHFNGKLLDNLTKLETVYIPRGFIYVQGNRKVTVREYESDDMPDFMKEEIRSIERELPKHYEELKQWFDCN